MARPDKKKFVAFEIWLPIPDAKHLSNHMTKPNESRKQAAERIITNAVTKSRKTTRTFV